MSEPRTPDRALLSRIRELLLPVWRSVHEADVVWHRSKEIPQIASEAMCRHSVAFLRRVMIEADRHNGIGPRSKHSLTSCWTVVRGSLDARRLSAVPAYALRNPTHYVVMDASGAVIDLTADQFGLDPLATHASKTFFDAEPVIDDPGLVASARTWLRAGDCASVVEMMSRI